MIKMLPIFREKIFLFYALWINLFDPFFPPPFRAAHIHLMTKSFNPQPLNFVIHDPISYCFFIHILLSLFWPYKTGLLIMDHASLFGRNCVLLFAEVVHSYLPKPCIPICRFSVYCYLPITTRQR